LDETASYGYLEDAQKLPQFKMVWHDLRARIHVTAQGCRPLGEPFDWVCHLAAASHVDRSIRDPAAFVQDNVLGTVHMFEWVRETQPDVKKVLYFSTDEVFGPASEQETFEECSRHWPNNPYAASKAGAEALCPAYANTYGMPIAVTHCTNVYGPRQHEEKFIPLVRRKVLERSVVQIHSRNGVPSTRYYVHVADVCAAVLTVLKRGAPIASAETGKYNISGDREWSNLDVAKKIAAAMGKSVHTELVDFVPNRPKHDQRYSVGGHRLHALGWVPRVRFDQGLAETLDWYQEQDDE
jgi:dTDP-glucose 4,6-dehydratase